MKRLFLIFPVIFAILTGCVNVEKYDAEKTSPARKQIPVSINAYNRYIPTDEDLQNAFPYDYDDMGFGRKLMDAGHNQYIYVSKSPDYKIIIKYSKTPDNGHHDKCTMIGAATLFLFPCYDKHEYKFEVIIEQSKTGKKQEFTFETAQRIYWHLTTGLFYGIPFNKLPQDADKEMVGNLLNEINIRIIDMEKDNQ